MLDIYTNSSRALPRAKVDMLWEMTQTRLVFWYHDLVYLVRLRVIMPNMKIFSFSVEYSSSTGTIEFYATVTTRDLSNLPKHEVEKRSLDLEM
jgi:hypothetical protein